MEVKENLSTQVQVSFRIDFHKIIVHKIIDEIDGFTCGFHFGTQLLIYVGRFVKREHWFLDGISLLRRIKSKVFGLFLSQHRLGRIVNIWLIVGFANKRYCSRSAWVRFYDINFVMLDCKLNVDQTHRLKRKRDLMSVVFNLFDYKITEIVRRQNRI